MHARRAQAAIVPARGFCHVTLEVTLSTTAWLKGCSQASVLTDRLLLTQREQVCCPYSRST